MGSHGGSVKKDGADEQFIGCHEGLIVLASIIDGICWIIADVPCAFYCE